MVAAQTAKLLIIRNPFRHYAESAHPLGICLLWNLVVQFTRKAQIAGDDQTYSMVSGPPPVKSEMVPPRQTSLLYPAFRFRTPSVARTPTSLLDLTASALLIHIAHATHIPPPERLRRTSHAQ
jgi:hypothetical protein